MCELVKFIRMIKEVHIVYNFKIIENILFYILFLPFLEEKCS